MVRKIRIACATAGIFLMTLLFLDFTGTVFRGAGWLAKMQFVPAILAGNAAAIIMVLSGTVLFGRVYCSIVCPLGIFQDSIARIFGNKQYNRYRYRRPVPGLRYVVLLCWVIALVGGMGVLSALMDPSALYGRMIVSLIGPGYKAANNGLSRIAAYVNSDAFYAVPVRYERIGTVVIAGVSFGIMLVLSGRYGRIYCNTLCPVGTVLGILSRFSIGKLRIDPEKCTACGKCATQCKAVCIESTNGTIDYSRCVMCFNCMDSCPQGAIGYSFRGKLHSRTGVGTRSPDAGTTSRRSFLSLVAVGTATVVHRAYAKNLKGSFPSFQEKEEPQRSMGIIPPGALDRTNFGKHCTACQLCVSVCPNQILRPAGELKRFMRPEISYLHGYCRPECTKCSSVCPTGAIQEITAAEKSAIQIGHAVWRKERCIVITDQVNCTVCFRHCPTGAIRRVAQDPDNPLSRLIPIIDSSRCIGCGACEYLCPSRPSRAMYVEGHARHQII